MEFFQLKRLYDFSMRALEKPSAYLKGVPGDTTLYRAEGTDIMPFADVLPLTQRPALQPLPPRQALQQALALRPGKINLAEADKGAIVKERESADQPQAGSTAQKK
ncbi:g2559 [Coccomyxa viridis]|uniref:G2559 protein n=1 Tax=Coccomyxa viridis TaxID=1274662 RepID=A0ABP1FSR9_9CHLO